jgi:hypothetical protein
MLEFIQIKLVTLFLAAIPVGAIAFLLYQAVKRFTVLVDAIKSPWVHRLAIAGISFVLTAVFAALGLDINCVEGVNCLQELSKDKIEMVLQAGLSAVSAFLIHAGRKSRR